MPELTPVLDFGDNEKVTLELPDANGKTFPTTFFIESTIDLDTPEGLASLGGVLAPVDPNGAIKVIRKDEKGNLIVVYFGHSDEGAFEDLRNAARDGDLTGNNGSAVTDKGITTFEVTQNTVLTGGDGGPIYVEDIIYNAQAGTHFVTCESYGANNVVDGRVVTTSAWRYLELKPTPTPPQQAQVQPQPRLSRGLIAKRARSASAIREVRAQARIENQGTSTSGLIYQAT